MLGKRNWLLVAVTLSGCGGDAFTSDGPDGGGTMKDGGLFQVDATIEDGAIDDAQVHKDGGKGRGDDDGGGVIGVDAGPIGGFDAGLPCATACPSGFSCLVGKCIDRAAAHFSTTVNGGGNWTYGSRLDPGSPFLVYPHEWRVMATPIDFWGRPTEAIELSAFHNGGIVSQVVDGMTVPAGALALHPGGSTYSVARWTAPKDGFYALDVTFTGLTYTNGMIPMVGVGFVFGNVVPPASSSTINAFAGTNTATLSAPAQMFSAGSPIDFFVHFFTSVDDEAGGTQVDVRITAQ